MRPDIVGDVPVYSAGSIYWPEQIHFLDKHNLSEADMVMTIRFALIELKENGELTFRQLGAIAQSSCELVPALYTVRDGSLFLDKEGVLVLVRTTDQIQQKRGRRSRLMDLQSDFSIDL